MELFTIDRRQTLAPNTTYALTVHEDISPEALAQHVEALFPEGVSAHGEMYFLKNSSHVLNTNPLLELVFEYVRRARFPHLPSRFQCMFAVGSMSAAKDFQVRVESKETAIYRVEADTYIRADMNLLHTGTLLVTSYMANLYWSGEPHPEQPPFWEYLLKCPVRVGERVA